MVRIDQRNLKHLLEQRLVCKEHHKSLTKLLGFEFEIEYKSGGEYKGANPLSRMSALLDVIMAQCLDIIKLMSEMKRDRELIVITKALKEDPDCKPR